MRQGTQVLRDGNRKFFDTVKHEILRKLLHKRVRDGVITRLIGKWLKAGVLEDGSKNDDDEENKKGPKRISGGASG
jgi:hypothetical protein